MSQGNLSDSSELANALEAAINLVYLIRIDPGDSVNVLEWANHTDTQLQRIADVLRKAQ